MIVLFFLETTLYCDLCTRPRGGGSPQNSQRRLLVLWGGQRTVWGPRPPSSCFPARFRPPRGSPPSSTAAPAPRRPRKAGKKGSRAPGAPGGRGAPGRGGAWALGRGGAGALARAPWTGRKGKQHHEVPLSAAKNRHHVCVEMGQ